MSSIFTNRILKGVLLGFFALATLLTPLSISVSARPVSVLNTLDVSIGVVHAQNAATDFAVNSISGGVVDTFTKWVGYYFMEFFALFTRAGGVLLDTSLDQTVFRMAENADNKSMRDTINGLWSLIRDICNLAFIFGFIYIGIRTIIDPESASTKRFLSRIIIGALLINFSLFFAKAIIDFSNFTAYQIYKSMVIGSGSLTETIMNELHLVTFYNGSGLSVGKDIGISFYLMAGLFLLITAFVFFAGALLLVVRFVALILIMVASPLLFAATVFPQTENVAGDLWKKLISYSFLAPVYILLVLISIKLLQGMNIPGEGDILPALQGGPVGSGGVSNMAAVLNFTVAIFFMISSLTIATKMGGKAGEMAVGFANNLRGRAQSFMGRNSLGWIAHKTREGYEKLDARANAADGKTLKGFGLKALRGGVAATAFGDRNLREGLKGVEHAKFGGSYSYEDDEKYDKERKARQAKVVELDKIVNSVKTGTAAPVGNPARIGMERSVAGASNPQMLELLNKFEEDSNEFKELVANMTSAQFDALMKLKEDELDDGKKFKLSEIRARAVEQRLIANTPGAVNISDVIGKADSKDLDALSDQTLEDNAEFLTSKQIDSMSRPTPTLKARLKDRRKNDLNVLAGVPGGMGTIFARFKEDEVAKLPNTILTNPAAAPFLNSNMLSKILDNDGVGPADRAQIKANVIAVHGPGAFNNFFTTPRGGLF